MPARYPAKSLPYRSDMTCGCVMRLSRRQRMRGEHWCPRHRRVVRVVVSVAVVPKTYPSHDLLTGWDVL